MIETIGILSDFPEERWPSMDLVSSRFKRSLDELNAPWAELCPKWKSLPSPLTSFHNLARFYNRYIHYPTSLRASAAESLPTYFVVDHSYGHLVRELPAHAFKTVYCHDVDLFTDPNRSMVVRKIADHVMAGMRQADLIFCSNQVTESQIKSIFPGICVEVAGLGVDPPLQNISEPDLPAGFAGKPYLLHVGSHIPRKRIDVLLKAFALCSTENLRLAQVGEVPDRGVTDLVSELGLQDRICFVGPVHQSELASWYQGASALVLTSDAEGFGLPVIEAASFGKQVIASDLPVIREISGGKIRFANPGDPASFASQIDEFFGTTEDNGLALQEIANRYSWLEMTRSILRACRERPNR